MKKKALIIVLLILNIGFSLPVTASSQEVAENALRGISLTHLKLKGTLFTRSTNPLAIIEDTRNNQVVMYEIGDKVEGHKILHITRGEVTFDTISGGYKLSFPDGAVWQKKEAELLDTGGWYKIRREGNTFITDRETIQNGIKRVRPVMKNVKIAPNFKKGKVDGIKIASLNKIGILKEIGVKEGDVIKKINNHTLNSPYQVFDAYRKLKDTEELEVSITRNGRPLVLKYRIEKSLK